MKPSLERIQRVAAKAAALIEEHDDLFGLLAFYGSPERPDYRFVTSAPARVPGLNGQRRRRMAWEAQGAVS